MNGFGGAGAFSDGKYNITNQFGGTLYEYLGRKQAIDLMEYVDKINIENGGEGTKLYSTGNTKLKKECMQNDLHLLEAQVRHLGTDKNYVVLKNLYEQLKERVEIHFNTHIDSVEKLKMVMHYIVVIRYTLVKNVLSLQEEVEVNGWVTSVIH